MSRLLPPAPTHLLIARPRAGVTDGCHDGVEPGVMPELRQLGVGGRGSPGW